MPEVSDCPSGRIYDKIGMDGCSLNSFLAGPDWRSALNASRDWSAHRRLPSSRRYQTAACGCAMSAFAARSEQPADWSPPPSMSPRRTQSQYRRAIGLDTRAGPIFPRCSQTTGRSRRGHLGHASRFVSGGHGPDELERFAHSACLRIRSTSCAISTRCGDVGRGTK
jgi:hypothetical protein